MTAPGSLLSPVGGTADAALTDALGPVGARVDALIADAIDRRASDLHLDPAGGGTRIRLRIDGFFEDGAPIPAGLHERLVARVKILAGLTVYRREDVQEGSIRRDGGVDLRVSILPTVAGEKVTIRVFDPAARPLCFEEMGFRPEVERALCRVTSLRQGAVLVAGPSGSGKTTTLYAALHRIQRDRGSCTNLCSVEDPVEMAIEGVHQVPVGRDRGLSFARGLQALLRQDPEVILVGEIRDVETAAIAVEAGLTGHLVLSSVHAGSSAEALSRLLDLGVEPYLAASSIKAVIAQRLVRRLCAACSEPAQPDVALLAAFGLDRHGEWRRSAGCERCRRTGYSGRIPISEVLLVDRATSARMIAREEALVLASGLNGGYSLLDDGIDRARRGETTLEEVARVAERGDAKAHVGSTDRERRDARGTS